MADTNRDDSSTAMRTYRQHWLLPVTKLCPFVKCRITQLYLYLYLCLVLWHYRFHIHRYNEDALLACAMPFHESQQFVRVVQLLRIKDPTHRWHWLFPLQVIMQKHDELSLSAFVVFYSALHHQHNVYGRVASSKNHGNRLKRSLWQ